MLLTLAARDPPTTETLARVSMTLSMSPAYFGLG
jgi:hypothetical protein